MSFRHFESNNFLSVATNLTNPLFARKVRRIRDRGRGAWFSLAEKLSDKPLEKRRAFKQAKSETQAKISCSEIGI